MRKFLDALYRGSGALAAMFLLAICLIVLAQVGANIVSAAYKALTGEAIGLVIPSYAEFAGFFLAASTFLGLAYALNSGAHIRVSLVIQNFHGRSRQIVELWCVIVGGVFSGYFAWYTVGLVLESYEFGDLSPGMVPVPLWIVQVPMALGLIILTIAFVDSFFTLLAGRMPPYERDDPDTADEAVLHGE